VLLVIVAVVLSGSGTTDPAVPSGPSVSGYVLPTNGECPEDFPYKAHENRDGELKVHSPGGQFYDVTTADRCYKDVEVAVADGYVKSQR